MSGKLIYRGAIQALAALALLCAPLFSQISAVTTPGFKNGTLTVGRDADSLYKLPPVATASTGYVMVSNGLNGEMVWSAPSAAGWTLLGDTVQTDSTVRMDGDMTFIRNVRLGQSGGVGGNVSSSTPIAIDVLIPTENNFATTKFYVDSLRNNLIYYDFSIADSTADIKEAVKGAWATAGEALAFGDIVYFASDSAWYKSDADTTGTEFVKRGMGFVTADISNGSTGTIMLRGAAKAVGWNWTSIGRDLYVSTTAGRMTQSPDTSAGNAVQIIGWSPHPDFIIFNPSPAWARK